MDGADRKEKENQLCGKYHNISRLLAIHGIAVQDREDLLHDILLHALRSLDQLRDVNKMDAWLWRITLNEVNRYWHAMMVKREAVYAIKAEEFEQRLSGSSSGTHLRLPAELERLADRDELIRALRRLPDETLLLFRLHYFSGYKLTEIAQMTGESKNTVKSRHRRGLARLKILLEQTG